MKYQEFCESLARDAATIIRKYYFAQEITLKEDSSPVTQADTEVNALVIRRISESFPEDGVLGEEESRAGKNTRVWVCDPIDGTLPYTMHLPFFTFGLALVDDGEPIVGLIYDIISDRLYYAEKGEGAFCNNERIRVNNKGWSSAKINYDNWPLASSKIKQEVHALLESQGIWCLKIPAALIGHSRVADGNMEAAYLAYSKPWDIAPSVTIVREAGGVVTDLAGNNQRYDQEVNGAIVSNGVIHDKLLAVLQLSEKSKF